MQTSRPNAYVLMLIKQIFMYFSFISISFSFIPFIFCMRKKYHIQSSLQSHHTPTHTPMNIYFMAFCFQFTSVLFRLQIFEFYQITYLTRRRSEGGHQQGVRWCWLVHAVVVICMLPLTLSHITFNVDKYIIESSGRQRIEMNRTKGIA